MTSLEVTALTDFVLAGEALFLAGMTAASPKLRGSAAWYWSWFLALLGAGALLGGIDHGFIEPAGLPRFWIQRLNWFVLVAMTFCLLVATVKQFFAPRLHRAAEIVAVAQAIGGVVAVLWGESFRVVVLNYVPVMVLLLAMNLARLGKGGSPAMIAGMAILFAASGLQAAGVDTLAPLDHNGLFHIGTIIGVVPLYMGGLRLFLKR